MDIYRRINDMKVQSTTSFAAAVRPRPILNIAGIVGLVALGVILIAGHYTNHPTIKQTKGVFQNIFAPVISLLSQPADYIDYTGERISNIMHVYEKNLALQSQNAELLKWQSVAYRLEQENRELRSFLGVSAAQDVRYSTAHIISDTHDPISHSIIIEHTGDSAIQEGLPVITPEGMLGHVVETSGTMARVLLITDRQSRIPVEHEQHREHGILTGINESDEIRLNHTENAARFAPGDRIVTSRSHLFPIEIVIGEVASVSDNVVTITPYADARKHDYVSIAIPLTPLPSDSVARLP